MAARWDQRLAEDDRRALRRRRLAHLARGVEDDIVEAGVLEQPVARLIAERPSEPAEVRLRRVDSLEAQLHAAIGLGDALRSARASSSSASGESGMKRIESPSGLFPTTVSSPCKASKNGAATTTS